MDTETDILQDIYRLDPSLRAEDAAVRALVADLTSKRPPVVPDQAFVARLRAELVGDKVASPGPVRSPWYFYAAPVGVFALLLLMLVPKYVTSPTTPASLPDEAAPAETTTEEAAPALYRTIPTEEVTDVPVGGGASMKSVGGAPEATAPAMDGGVSLMALPMSDEPVNSLTVSAQRPGTTVSIESVYATVPALVVIYRDATVIGVSTPVAPGFMTETSVVLAAPARSGEELTAVLYADNDGDSIFTPGTDVMLTDAYGNPLEQTFSIR